MQCVRNCDSPDPKKREYFQQPVIQTAQMFIGEMGSWLIVAAYAIFRRQSGRSTKSGYEPVVGDAQSDRSATPDVGRSDAVDGEEYSDAVDRAVTVVKPLVDGRHGHAELEPLRGIMTAVIAVPACCDIAGTTLMNIGLLFVAASIYQMTRGALVIFTGLLSVLFLRRRLASYKWAGLFIVVAGVAIVGLAGAVARDHKAVPGSGTSADGYGHGIKEDIQLHARSVMETLGNALRHRSMESREAEKTPLAVQTLIGVFLIACAQIFTAAQFVVEERIMERYSIGPLQMVGWEGTFGFTVTLVGMIVLHLIIGRTPAGQYGYFDLQEGLRELSENRAIGLSSVLIMISIG